MRCYIELSEYRPIPDIEQVFLSIIHNRYSLVAMVTITVCSFSVSGWVGSCGSRFDQISFCIDRQLSSYEYNMNIYIVYCILVSMSL